MGATGTFGKSILFTIVATLLSACGGGGGGGGNGNDDGTVTRYSIGGTVSGLEGTGLVLRNNSSDPLHLSTDGDFTFSTGIADGGQYEVTVATQPTAPDQTCSVANHSGTVSGSAVTNVNVVCVTATYTVGGTVSGLLGTGLVLHNNGGDAITISDNGGFIFPTALPDLSSYSVTVANQPTGPEQDCSVTNGSGTLAGGPAMTVSINCQSDTYTVGGTVSGLDGTGLVLEINNGDAITISDNGSFTFPAALPDGTSYSVTLASQPTGPDQTCSVTNGSGTLAGGPVTTVSVSCETNTYTVGGTVSGLDGTGLVLHNNDGDALNITVDGPFTFPTELPDGSDYSVTVASQPTGPDQGCSVTDGSGTLSGGPVTTISINCESDSYTVGGTVIGLDGTDLVLHNNGVDAITISADGSFTFPTPVYDRGAYQVRIAAQPSGTVQQCAIVNGSGEISGANVTGVTVVCPVVEAFYPVNGADWNDYVANDGADDFSATDAPCPSSAGADYTACLHAGAMRRITLPGITDCAGFAAQDELGAFQWTCDESADAVHLVSTGLQAGMRLVDLLSTAGEEWRTNVVTVTRDGAPYARTNGARWWSNNIVTDNDGGSLSEQGTIYLVTSDASTTYTLDADGVSLVIVEDLTLTGPGSFASVISATNQSHLWLEGQVDALDDQYGVRLENVTYSVLRHLSVQNTDPGDGHPIALEASSNNRIQHVIVARGRDEGLYLTANSNGNLVQHLTASNNRSSGLHLNSSHGNQISFVTAVSNSASGILLVGSTDNVVTNITVANNVNGGVESWTGSNHNLYMNIAGVNNLSSFYFRDVARNTVVNLVSTDNTAHSVVNINGDRHYFTGLLKAGGNDRAPIDCLVENGTSPGLIHMTCADTYTDGASTYTGQLSDAVLQTEVDQSGTYVGRVTDDTVNPDDTSGTATFSTGLDWLDFESPMRAWGKDTGFPSRAAQGRLAGCTDPLLNTQSDCETAGETWIVQGVIYDWRLSAGDTGDEGGPAALGILELPNGDQTVSHAWSSGNETLFLRNATEVVLDGRGNDNGLCESGESCLYTPNAGADQGHGERVDAGPFTGGVLTGIDLRRYEFNGQ